MGVVALGASLVGITGRQPPASGPGTDPEAGVSLRAYPVPQPTATPSDVARNLRKVESAPPTTNPPTYARPTVTHTQRPSPTKPERTRPARPRPSRVCYVFHYNGHTYRFCGSHPPHR